MKELDSIVARIQELLEKKQPVLVAIDGYGGAGKTTLARAIQSEFLSSAIITLDDFATDIEGPADRKRFLSQVLLPLSNGIAANYQRFDWPTQALAEWREVRPNGLIIIEGVSTLGEDFNSYYDLRVWIDCPHELASQRGMERDKNIYGVNHEQLWKEIWIPGEREYGKTEPWNRADMIVPIHS